MKKISWESEVVTPVKKDFALYLYGKMVFLQGKSMKTITLERNIQSDFTKQDAGLRSFSNFATQKTVSWKTNSKFTTH